MNAQGTGGCIVRVPDDVRDSVNGDLRKGTLSLNQIAKKNGVSKGYVAKCKDLIDARSFVDSQKVWQVANTAIRNADEFDLDGVRPEDDDWLPTLAQFDARFAKTAWGMLNVLDCFAEVCSDKDWVKAHGETAAKLADTLLSNWNGVTATLEPK